MTLSGETGAGGGDTAGCCDVPSAGDEGNTSSGFSCLLCHTGEWMK